MKIYISGEISSCLDTYKEVFKKKQEELEQKGHVVINPSAIPLESESSSYLHICLAMIDESEAIYMLDGFDDSKKALVEMLYADYQGKQLLFD